MNASPKTARGSFINFGITRKTVFDENRGMSSYGALKGRLGTEDILDSRLLNTNRTVLPLKPLSVEDIYTLLDNLNYIYNIHYIKDISMSTEHIKNREKQTIKKSQGNTLNNPRIYRSYVILKAGGSKWTI